MLSSVSGSGFNVTQDLVSWIYAQILSGARWHMRYVYSSGGLRAVSRAHWAPSQLDNFRRLVVSSADRPEQVWQAAGYGKARNATYTVE